MKLIRILSFVVILLSLSFVSAKGQQIIRQSIGIAGSSIQQDNTMIRYTVGQAYNPVPIQNNSETVRQGFQQPLAGIDTRLLVSDSFELLVYPNPVSDHFYVNISGSESAYRLAVHNVLGQEIFNTSVLSDIQTTVSSANWKEGIYIISIYNNERLLAVKRIIKN